LKYYDGDYNNETGYVRSKRVSTHEGIKESQWEHPLTDEDEELDRLSKSIYPWNIFGSRLKRISDQQKHMVTEWTLKLWATLAGIAAIVIGVSTSEPILRYIKDNPILSISVTLIIAGLLWWQAKSPKSIFKK